MRVMVVHPGPAFSVADVHRGWVAGLRSNGCEVLDFNFDARLDFYSQVALHRDGEWTKALDTNAAIQMASKSIEAAAYEFWPDVVVFVSCFFVPAFTMQMLRARGHKIVILHTECPYEDEGQVERAAFADLNVLNDPASLERFRAVAPAEYIPHAYDPAVHYSAPARPELASDFCFVGTGFPSRVAFLEQVDWTGIDVALAGMWLRTRDDWPLRKFVAHDIEHCVDNTETVDLYRSTKVSANLYRKEGLAYTGEAWAMGPREVELAAIGTFFLREPRGEGDELFPMLPTFDGPGDFGEKLRWWLAHDDERDAAALAAQAAVAGRTFHNHAARLLQSLDSPTCRPGDRRHSQEVLR